MASPERIRRTIEFIQSMQPPDGYWLAFSGGKDSTVLYDLTVKSGVKFEAHYAMTGIDPPELMRFIKDNYPDVIWDKPKHSFWRGMYVNGLPTRRMRWCCEELKEYSGRGRTVLHGVRKAESRGRSTYQPITPCQKQHKVWVAPLLDWSDGDVWHYIGANQMPYCCLYDEGKTRIGCVGCPMSGKRRLEEFARWPGLAKAWRKAADSYWLKRITTPGGTKFIERFPSSAAYWHWWIEDKEYKDEF